MVGVGCGRARGPEQQLSSGLRNADVMSLRDKQACLAAKMEVVVHTHTYN